MTDRPAPARQPSRAPQDLAGGAFLVALAALGLFLARDLPMGRIGAMGPGMLPVVVAVLVGALGLALVVQAFLADGPALERWSVRGPVFILGAVILFALTIRPFGITVAGPLVILVGGLADRDSRPVELLIFGLVMTALCAGLFRYALGLPIPVAPWSSLGY